MDATLDPVRDGRRIDIQRERVWNLMRDGQWRTLAEIEEATGAPQASASARLRDFRKSRYGAHAVQRMHVHNGLHKYRVVPRAEAAA